MTRTAQKRPLWHRIALWTVLGASLVAAVGLGASSVRTWMDQNVAKSQAEQIGAELEGVIAEYSAEIDRRTSSDEVHRAALCFGPFVEPGTEVYAVTGLAGCVTDQHGS